MSDGDGVGPRRARPPGHRAGRPDLVLGHPGPPPRRLPRRPPRRARARSARRSATARDLGELRRFVEAGRVRPVEPVLVGHEGEPLELDVRVPSVGGPDRVVVHLQPDGAEPLRFELVLDALPEVGRVVADGREHTVHRIRLDLGPAVGVGYHHLTVELGGGAARQHPDRGAPAGAPARPRRAHLGRVRRPLRRAPRRRLRPQRQRPRPHRLVDRGPRRPGRGHAARSSPPTSPSPYDPSPYAPVSQRHWNELYLDISATPELAASEAARRLLDDPATRAAAEAIRTADLFDHRGRYALRAPGARRAGRHLPRRSRRRPGRLRPLGGRPTPTPSATPGSGPPPIARARAGTRGASAPAASPAARPAAPRRPPTCGPSGR